jgi:hypothetical protein
VNVTADQTGVAHAALRAPSDTAVAWVRVKLEDALREDSVVFGRAAAEQVLVEPDHFSIAAGIRNEIRITAQLRRASGKVAAGTPVTFHAYKYGTNEEIGVFGVPSLSDATGQVTVRYSAGDTAYRGPVRIVASAEGGAVTGEALVQVTD